LIAGDWEDLPEGGAQIYIKGSGFLGGLGDTIRFFKELTSYLGGTSPKEVGSVSLLNILILG